MVSEPISGITALPDESNGRYFKVQMSGPKDVCIFKVLDHITENSSSYLLATLLSKGGLSIEICKMYNTIF